MSWSAVGDKTLSYSFVLTDPRLQDAFLEEYSPKLKALGFDLSFVENNAKNFVAGADPLRKSLLMGAVLFAVALLMAIVFSVFLYLRQQRRNYAVLRALGVPARISNKQLILPLLGLGLLGSVIGALFSWQNAHNRAAESFQTALAIWCVAGAKPASGAWGGNLVPGFAHDCFDCLAGQPKGYQRASFGTASG